MGYQALLFCADERLARVVSQIFSELEFNLELVNEPFSAVKKLMAQHYDAIVVDCENEQNASLIFKSARNSAGNQNSLALALVEGQAGVAKAYRIGANLVLTKPINVEQAKGTLRVARGLLRKNADAGAGKVSPPAVPVTQVSSAPSASAARASTFAAPEMEEQKAAFAASSEKAVQLEESVQASGPTPAAAVPAFEPAPVVAASAKVDEPAAAIPEIKAETSVVKELPAKADLAASVSKPTPAPSVQEHNTAVTFANLQGAAAAPARAKEKVAAAKSKVAETELFETSSTKTLSAGVVAAPTFSAVGDTPSEGTGAGKKFLAIAAIAIVAFGLGYFAWTKFGDKGATPQAQNAVQSTQPATSSQPTATPSSIANQAAGSVQSNAVPAAAQGSKPAAGTSSAPVTKIAVGSDDAKSEVITRTFEPAPIHVKTQSQGAKVQKQADESSLAVPDPLGIGSSKDTSLASLVPGPAKLPAAPASTLKISQGVSQGLLIKKVQPVYPPNAKTMRLEGPVEMEAVIDREGKITNLKVLKGQPVLARAAVDAVRQWRYKPYYLDGEPVEIQTQITVVFKMPN